MRDIATETISIGEAHRRFGDLARIRNGITTWLEIATDDGVWKPVFQDFFSLTSYEFYPNNSACHLNSDMAL